MVKESGDKVERKEKRTEWYRSIDLWTKKIEEALPLPKVVMGIQGVWVADEDPASTFDHCSDEVDSLAVFQYRDPCMLAELVDRRIVEDIGRYFDAFQMGARRKPPSLVLVADDLPYYVHVPQGKTLKRLHSLDCRPPSSPIFLSRNEPEIPMGRPAFSHTVQGHEAVTVTAMAGVPFL